MFAYMAVITIFAYMAVITILAYMAVITIFAYMAVRPCLHTWRKNHGLVRTIFIGLARSVYIHRI